MDQQNKVDNQNIANILRQQPINPTESDPNTQIRQLLLDQRIKSMQTIVEPIQQPPRALLKLTSSINKSRNQKSAFSLHQSSISTSPLQSTSKEIINKPQSILSLPTIQIPKKSALSFIQRFTAHHANRQNPDYRKIATITCEKNQDIPIYLFKDEKRAYKAANEHSTNQYKFGG